jgi:hypothetical protein
MILVYILYLIRFGLQVTLKNTTWNLFQSGHFKEQQEDYKIKIIWVLGTYDIMMKAEWNVLTILSSGLFLV